MIFTATTTTYNNVFVSNYSNLVDFAQGDIDRVHNCYIKVLENITAKPFTGYTTTGIDTKLIVFTKTAIYNRWKTEMRLKKNTVTPDDCEFELEETLLEAQQLNEDNRTHEEQLEYITLKLFEYIKKHFTESEVYLFTVYYLYDKDRRITYEQLSKITGYSVSKCCIIIQKIKSELRKNLIPYINNG